MEWCVRRVGVSLLGLGLAAGLALVAGCRFGGNEPLLPAAHPVPGGSSGSRAPRPGAPDDELLAIVGGRRITAGELRHRILDRYYGMPALQGLIKEELFQREATRLGIAVSDTDVAQRVDAEIESLLAQLGHDRAQLEAALVEQGTTLQSHRRTLTHEVQNLLLVERVVLAHRKRTGVTEKAIREHHARTFAQARVFVRHLAFPLEDLDSAAAASEPDAAARARSLAQAEQACARLREGESFGQLARTVSGDPVTAERDGRLGWIDRTSLRDDRLTEAIFALPVGVVSAPVYQEGYGHHVFLVEERTEALSLEVARPRIEAQLLESPPTQTEIRSVEYTLRAQTPVTILPAAPGAPPASLPGRVDPAQ